MHGQYLLTSVSSSVEFKTPFNFPYIVKCSLGVNIS